MEEQKGFSPAMREHFVKLGKSLEEIAALESGLANKGQAARDAGIESKDAAAADTAATETTDAQPVYVTAQEVAAAIAEVIKPITDALAALTVTQSAIADDVKALQATDAEKIAKQAAATPRASLQDLIAASIIGQPAAQLDGRSALAKAGPKQSATETSGVTPSPFLNGLMHRSQGGAQ